MGAIGAAVVVFVGVAVGMGATRFMRRMDSKTPPIDGDKNKIEDFPLRQGFGGQGGDVALGPESPDNPQACPICHSEFPPDQAFCVKDGSALVHGDAETPVSVCPTCQRGFPADSQFCPHDAEELIPYAQFKAQRIQSSIPPRPMAKICPQCSQGYAARQSFCAVDGTPLIILN